MQIKGFFLLGILMAFCLITQDVRSQETLHDMVFSPKIKIDSTGQQNSRINLPIQRFIYVIDTLELPFFDDFTTDKIKRFDAKLGDPNISLKINYTFSVNGNNPPKLEYMTDTTYFVTKTGNNYEYSPNPELYIKFYEDGKVVGYDTGWTNIIPEFDQGTGLVTTDTLFPDRTLVNVADTFFRVADNNTIWTFPLDTADSLKSPPLINNTFAKNPVTQGVATFDGTNAAGFPYDITSPTSYGIGDVLTSKPLALDSTMQNVFLSFFYQRGGNGNAPEQSDSLCLEFFNVIDSAWQNVWSAEGNELGDTLFSNQIFVPISGRPYLQNGFRFRFKNYATLSGGYDHWHLDYIRVNQNRDTALEKNNIPDLAFVSASTSLLTDYQSVPYWHYLSDPGFFDASEAYVILTNLNESDSVNLAGLKYEVFDPFGNLLTSGQNNEPNVESQTVLRSNFPINDTPIFTDTGEEFADFDLIWSYSATGSANAQRINDTLKYKQAFRDFYAYDDGSAEKAYALTGAGLQLAYEFNMPLGDTLLGVYFNFPQVEHDNNGELNVEVRIWEDLDNEPIYIAEQAVEPAYTNANAFFRIKLDNPVFVGPKYYVGFRQTEAEKIYIGFDVNNDHSSKINYRIGEIWYGSSYSGALLIRPDFGNGSLMAAHAPVEKSNDFGLYPNPASSQVILSGDASQILEVMVFDMAGRLHPTRLEHDQLNLESFSPGVYFVQIITQNSAVHTLKLVVQK